LSSFWLKFLNFEGFIQDQHFKTTKLCYILVKSSIVYFFLLFFLAEDRKRLKYPSLPDFLASIPT
jgi:uncharacterized membrane protein YwzB